MQTWTIVAFAAAGLAFAAVAAGFALPATRTGTAEAWIDIPPDRLSDLILDVEGQTRWRRDLQAVSAERDGWTERTTSGETVRFWTMERTPERIVIGFKSDCGYSGTWTGLLRPDGNGTILTATESATTPSPVGRILSRLFFDPCAHAEAYLAALATEAKRTTSEAP
jgi:hypothetical protein